MTGSRRKKGDIRKATWDQPFTPLFADLSKSWGINDHVVRTCFRWLNSGAVIAQQGKMLFKNPWFCSTMYKLRGQIRFAGHAKLNSLLFEVASKLDAADIAGCLATNTSE